MSIEEQIDNAIRDCAVRPGMCVYPNIRTRQPALPPFDAGALAAAAVEIDRLAEESTRLVRDHLGPMIAREIARRAGLPPTVDEPEPDAAPLPVYRRAVDEVKLLKSIRRDRSWWRRLARWIRRSRP